MKALVSVTLLILLSISGFGQGKIEKLKSEVLKEGFLLYEGDIFPTQMGIIPNVYLFQKMIIIK